MKRQTAYVANGDRVTRRQFVARAAATGLALPVCGSCDRGKPAPTTAPKRGPINIGQRDEFSTDGVTTRWAAKSRGGFFVVRREMKIYAISSVCTHLGCVLDVGDGEFDCGCHNSRFTQMGVVLHGPAKTPLLRYAIGVNDADQILVDRSRTFTPKQWDVPGSYVFIY